MSDANYNHKANADALRDGGTAAVLSVVDLKGGAAIPASWTSQEADSATAMAFELDTANAISTDLSKLLSLKNDGTELLNVRIGTDWYPNSGVAILELCDPAGVPTFQITQGSGYSELFSKSGDSIELGACSDWPNAYVTAKNSSIILDATAVHANIEIVAGDNAVAPGHFGRVNISTFLAGAFPGIALETFSNSVLYSVALNFDGRFTTPAAQAVHRQDASLQMAIAAANSLRTILLAHAADATEHTGGADTVSFASMPVAATTLATLITLVTYQLTSYAAHDTDAKAATPTYHQAQYAGSDLISTTAPTTLAEALVDLADLKAKYNIHDADATAHDVGSQHQETHTLYEYATVRQDHIIEVSDTVVAPSIVLSTADRTDGRIIIIKDKSGAAGINNITVSTEGAALIDGVASVPISVAYGVLTVYCDGTNWLAI